MPGSPNKAIINSLVETVKQKPKELDTAKLYDALQKMNQDLNKTYDALFDGPLPAVSGEKLDLTNLPRTNLPAGIAFTDVANIFSEAQTIERTRPELKLRFSVPAGGSGINGRVAVSTDGVVYISDNLYYDGAAWVCDVGNVGSMVFQSVGFTQFYSKDATGLLFCAQVSPKGTFEHGPVGFRTGAVVGDVIIANGKIFYGNNVAATKILSILQIDVNDLVQLGSNPVGAATGEGNISIPRAVTADLPTAGGTRNGIVILDKTNNRLCYYVSGARYYLTGTAF